MSEIKISRSVAQYIVQVLTKLIADGWGPEDVYGTQGMGIVNDIPMDSNPFRYVHSLLHFCRYIAGILDNALNAEELEESRALLSTFRDLEEGDMGI